MANWITVDLECPTLPLLPAPQQSLGTHLLRTPQSPHFGLLFAVFLRRCCARHKAEHQLFILPFKHFTQGVKEYFSCNMTTMCKKSLKTLQQGVVIILSELDLLLL